MKIKALIFDLGNVLIKFDHSIAAKRLAKRSPYTVEEIRDLIFDSDVVSRYETGKIKTRDFFLSLKRLLKLNIDYIELRKIWNEIFFDHLPMEKIVRRLKRNYRLILLSNINYSHYSYIKKRFPILKKFDKTILSYRVGFRKPHFQIYKKAIELCRCLPQEILYIDDREDLVLAAKKLGINSTCFRNIREFKKVLEKFGINSF